MKIICDSHIHSCNSFDAENSVEELCEKALELKLNTITITDHMEVPELALGAKSEYGDMKKQIAKSLKDIVRCQEIYKGRINVLKGIEMGEPMHDIKLTHKAFNIGEYDFVLASVHNLKNMEDFYYLDYNKLDVKNLLTEYFNELLDTAQNADFDSLAHLTYPLRYIAERTDIKVDLEDYKEIIDSIFIALIEREKALEINTSGLFKELKCTLPDISLVKRFKELGGKYVTVGSDAHNCENLAKGIDQGIEVVRTCGFKHYSIYENRTPRMIEIWY